jgi:cytochrome bd-type quinol oxidase subunit 2
LAREEKIYSFYFHQKWPWSWFSFHRVWVFSLLKIVIALRAFVCKWEGYKKKCPGGTPEYNWVLVVCFDRS